MIANVHRDSNKRPKPFTPADFMLLRRHAPNAPKVDAKENSAAMLSQIVTITTLFRGTDTRAKT